METIIKKEILNHLENIPPNRLKEVEMFMRFIIYETKQNNTYSNIDFLTSEQNNELERRLERFNNNEMNFMSLEEFKQKNKQYVQNRNI